MINENDTGRVLKAFFSNIANNLKIPHCVKSVQIQSFFWSVFSCIRTKYRKIRTRTNSVFRHFLRSARVYYSKYDPLSEFISKPVLKSIFIKLKSLSRIYIFLLILLLQGSIFSSSLKNTDITSVFKKADRKVKDKYRPVRKLSNILKIFERFIFQ